MNYEFSVNGQKVSILNTAKSLLDCHLLRHQYNRSQKYTPIKKVQNFQFALNSLSQTQTSCQLSTNRSKRTLQSSQKSRREKRFVPSELSQNLEFIEKLPKSNQSSIQRLNSPTQHVPNLQFNLNYHLRQLKFKQQSQKDQFWQDFSITPTPRGFTNRVYKIKKNDPKLQFYMDCSKRVNE
ncbi:unnamed protein product (macronuclear) [Paramecium tetraurelia]|uniref:Uncharacterized protein n=1 Tax=Paramecium tetraurelia TaxID=5888 RepID=A0BBX3_PARTE|nr:uncharacterized protein GSPATT00000475001 [Paramecium tetraurelia]CAK56040.1 unnamed protein product [Paramecium tetraurelia]|eukprot:XP_001423438.1 hypothetical protein (macronuclear) [Paramecium tetraurelia strain d4-2]